MTKLEFGYVYVIEDEFGRTKIGMTKNIKQRLGAIERGSGLSIVRKWTSNKITGYLKLEKHLHKTFEKHRANGEWFNASFDDIVSYIDTVNIEDEYNQIDIEATIVKNQKEQDMMLKKMEEREKEIIELDRQIKLLKIRRKTLSKLYEDCKPSDSDDVGEFVPREDDIAITFSMTTEYREVITSYNIHKDLSQEDIDYMFMEFILENTDANYIRSDSKESLPLLERYGKH